MSNDTKPCWKFGCPAKTVSAAGGSSFSCESLRFEIADCLFPCLGRGSEDSYSTDNYAITKLGGFESSGLTSTTPNYIVHFSVFDGLSFGAGKFVNTADEDRIKIVVAISLMLQLQASIRYGQLHDHCK